MSPITAYELREAAESYIATQKDFSSQVAELAIAFFKKNPSNTRYQQELNADEKDFFSHPFYNETITTLRLALAKKGLEKLSIDVKYLKRGFFRTVAILNIQRDIS